jgi:hypothetical protein
MSCFRNSLEGTQIGQVLIGQYVSCQATIGIANPKKAILFALQQVCFGTLAILRRIIRLTQL